MKIINDTYNELCNKPSDIHEHLPTLKALTEGCEHVTEMGVRWIISTYAFLAGKPKSLVSIDIQHPQTWNADLSRVETLAKENNIDFKFILSSTLEVDIDPTDLLFIDTWHAYKQLKAELNLHHTKVKKYIVLHDTTNFEYTDESSYEIWGDEWKGEGKGIWPAVLEFLEEHPEWEIQKRYVNNNGLTILIRK